MQLTDVLRYHNGRLHLENISLAALAEQMGTPVYVYSQTLLAANAQTVLTSIPPAPPDTLICYAVKANANPALLHLLGQYGFGADVTSGGELFLAQHAGIPADRIIFSGVGKTRPEIVMAIQAGIRALHVESAVELETIAEIATAHCRKVRIGVRVNPDISADTHPYMSTGQKTHKFGVSPAQAIEILTKAATHPWLEPVGLATHVGSQIRSLASFADVACFLVDMAARLAAQGIRLEYLDVGGGLGIDYDGQGAPSLADWVTAVAPPIHQAGYNLVMEPGRSIVGATGILLTCVTTIKQQGERTFVVVDAGMSDLIRPALYNAYHAIWPVVAPPPGAPSLPVDVVGPICETGDWLARERPFPPVRPGDLLAILHTGAYGFSMSSNYNGRLRPPEVLVHRDKWYTIRQRQDYHHLLDGCTPIQNLSEN